MRNSKPQSVLRFAFLVVGDFASVTFDHELKQFFVVRNFGGPSERTYNAGKSKGTDAHISEVLW